MSDKLTAVGTNRTQWQRIREDVRDGWEKIKSNDVVNLFLPLEDLSAGHTEAIIPYIVPGSGAVVRSSKQIGKIVDRMHDRLPSYAKPNTSAEKAIELIKNRWRNYRATHAISRDLDTGVKGLKFNPVALNESNGAVSRMIKPIEKQTRGRTSLAFFERPSKLTIGERAGIPRGAERTIYDNTDRILHDAQKFADKYGYKHPTTIEEARSMYDQHNTFLRTVQLPNEDNASLMGDLVGQPTEQQMKKLTTRGYPDARYTMNPADANKYSQDAIFVTPDYTYVSNTKGVEGWRTGIVERPWQKSNPLLWSQKADFTVEPYQYGQTKIGGAYRGNVDIGEVKLGTPLVYKGELSDIAPQLSHKIPTASR